MKKQQPLRPLESDWGYSLLKQPWSVCTVVGSGPAPAIGLWPLQHGLTPATSAGFEYTPALVYFRPITVLGDQPAPILRTASFSLPPELARPVEDLVVT